MLSGRIQQLHNNQRSFEERWPVIGELPPGVTYLNTGALACAKCEIKGSLRSGLEQHPMGGIIEKNRIHGGGDLCPVCHQWTVGRAEEMVSIADLMIGDIFAYQATGAEWLERFSGYKPSPHERAVFRKSNIEPKPYHINPEYSLPYSDNASNVFLIQPGHTLTVHIAPAPNRSDEDYLGAKVPTFGQYPIVAVYDGDERIYPTSGGPSRPAPSTPLLV